MTPRRALVVGLGRSGLAAVRVLAGCGIEVLAVDEQPDAVGRGPAVRAGATVLDADQVRGQLRSLDVVVPSPGVPPRVAVLAAARDAGVPVWSEPELGWRLFLEGADVPVVGVTGTNGKTSVTELVTAMLVAGGADAVACGNIGRPFSEAAAASTTGQILVAELSSFQLHWCEALRPAVGTLLNVADDHLDWHRDEQEYARAKARLWSAQRDDDWAVADADDERVRALAAAHAPARRAQFSGSGPVTVGVGVDDGVVRAELDVHRGAVLGVDELAIDAPHHRANIAAAACTALLAGAPVGAVADAARRFTPGHHRMQAVASHGDVTYIDDSKATNPHAAAASLRAHPSIVWVAGGLAKGVELGSLGDSLGAVRHAVLIGEASDELARVCAAAGVAADVVADMDAAVARCSEVARPGDTVLLAPACASFDMFRDYAERGDRFAAAARALPGAIALVAHATPLEPAPSSQGGTPDG